MRIGILTLPLHTNYGGILQAYALQSVLQRMGHDCLIIDHILYKPCPLWKRPFVYLKRALKKYLLKEKNISVFQEVYPTINQNTRQFINKNISRIAISDVRELNEKYFDAIIVGSDQIWRPKYYRTIENAYLHFTKGWNIKRIAYAASFGTEEWEYSVEQTELCAALIKEFDAISVREDSGVRLCKKHFNVEAKHVLDPTLLLTKEDYIRLFEKTKTRKSPGSLLCYILDITDKKKELIHQIKAKTGLLPFQTNCNVENTALPLKERIQPPVEDWLRGFYDAELIITDSFHACIFSIIFEKPFVVISNKERGLSRINSLLSMFNLSHLLINNISDYEKIHPLNTKYISIENKKKESFDFLYESLKNENERT